MPKKSKPLEEFQFVNGGKPLTEEQFWNNFRAVERLLERLFPDESFELRLSVPPTDDVTPGHVRVAMTQCLVEGKNLHEEKEETIQ